MKSFEKFPTPYRQKDARSSLVSVQLRIFPIVPYIKRMYTKEKKRIRVGCGDREGKIQILSYHYSQEHKHCPRNHTKKFDRPAHKNLFEYKSIL